MLDIGKALEVMGLGVLPRNVNETLAIGIGRPNSSTAAEVQLAETTNTMGSSVIPDPQLLLTKLVRTRERSLAKVVWYHYGIIATPPAL